MRKRNRVIAIIVIGVFLINYSTGYPFTYPIIEYRAKTLDLEPISTNLSEEDILNIYKILLISSCDSSAFLNPIAYPFDQTTGGKNIDETIGLPLKLLDFLGPECNIKWGRYEDANSNNFFSILMPTNRNYIVLSVPELINNESVFIDEYFTSNYGGGFVNNYQISKNSSGEWISLGSMTKIIID